MMHRRRSQSELRHHYEVEKELGARLRVASRAERLRLYREVYDERIERVPTHPLLLRSLDPAARVAATSRQLRLLRPFLSEGTRFLELGPGDGTLARAVARSVQKVYAVDVSLALVHENKFPDNLELLLTDGVSLPLAAESVDLAYSDQVLEHLHPDDAAEQTRNVCEALVPGGSYLCVTPHRFSGPWDVSRPFDDLATGLHLKEYTIEELVRLFRSTGFERVRAFLSFRGWRLSPLLGTTPHILLERGLEQMPRAVKRRTGYLLATVKILGTKPR